MHAYVFFLRNPFRENIDPAAISAYRRSAVTQIALIFPQQIEVIRHRHVGNATRTTMHVRCVGGSRRGKDGNINHIYLGSPLKAAWGPRDGTRD